MTQKEKDLIQGMSKELFQKDELAFEYWIKALAPDMIEILVRNIDDITIKVKNKNIIKVIYLKDLRCEKIKKINKYNDNNK